MLDEALVRRPQPSGCRCLIRRGCSVGLQLCRQLPPCRHGDVALSLSLQLPGSCSLRHSREAGLQLGDALSQPRILSAQGSSAGVAVRGDISAARLRMPLARAHRRQLAFQCLYLQRDARGAIFSHAPSAQTQMAFLRRPKAVICKLQI